MGCVKAKWFHWRGWEREGGVGQAFIAWLGWGGGWGVGFRGVGGWRQPWDMFLCAGVCVVGVGGGEAHLSLLSAHPLVRRGSSWLHLGGAKTSLLAWARVGRKEDQSGSRSLSISLFSLTHLPVIGKEVFHYHTQTSQVHRLHHLHIQKSVVWYWNATPITRTAPQLSTTSPPHPFSFIQQIK